ncbi:hypothetical protein [Janibacter terrae]|uniref:hypothetical protein n=1 Tax=Janibacter terrae TaxID=103817 RepID=UPI00082C4317|nr:hypothetical protein [Janibacter terrae]
MSDTKHPLEVVRVKDPSTGAEYNATRAHASNIHAKVLEGEPVVDKHGRPRASHPAPGKARTDLAGQTVISEKSTHEELDAAAAERGVDLTGATTKADKVAAITSATKEN